MAIIYLFPLSGPPGNNIAVLLHNKLGVTHYCIGGGRQVEKKRPRPFVASRLKGGFHDSAHVCSIYSSVHAFWHWPSFSLFMNQS